MVAVAFTAGTTIPAVAGALAAVAKASFVTGMVMGLMGVADKAGSDIANKEVSDVDEYAGKAAKDTFAGAVCGALFAPFMIPAAGTGLLGEIPTALQRTGTLLKTMYIGGTFNYTYYDLRERTDGRIPSIQQGVKVFRDGALFSGFIYTAGTAILEVAPFIKNAYKGTKGAAEAENVEGKTKYDNININSLSEEELAQITSDIRCNGGSPIEIPENARIKAQSKNAGYEQISYKWNAGTYTYEARWHTETPGAAQYGRGTTWVVTRTIPGNANGVQKVVQVKVGDTWVDNSIWQQAVRANQTGTATQEQMNMLENGHWLAK